MVLSHYNFIRLGIFGKLHHNGSNDIHAIITDVKLITICVTFQIMLYLTDCDKPLFRAFIGPTKQIDYTTADYSAWVRNY